MGFTMSKNKLQKGLMLSILLTTNVSWSQLASNKHSINNGGSPMTGGSFVLKSSIGQADASVIQAGGTFTLNGGFWHQLDTTPLPEIIFTNSFE